MIRFAQLQSHDAEQLDTDELGDEIAALAAHLDAATYRLLEMLREFDERGGWNGGFRTCAHWLSWRTGIDLGAAREKMRVARALADLPVLGRALQNGVLSYSKARALTRIATPENEAELLDLATHGTAMQVERVVRSWRRVDRIEEAELERDRHARRELFLHVEDDGSYVLRARLDAEVGALLERALEWATRELYAESTNSMNATPSRPAPAQQRADAIGLIAGQALSSYAEISGAGAETYQVVLHVDAAAMRTSVAATDAAARHATDGAALDNAGGNDGRAVAPEMSEFDNGVRVSAETSRRIACDAALVKMSTSASGEVLNVGRRTRTVPPAIRRALERRDGGCRFPGCGMRRCDAHHVRHWADGGETAMHNLVLLCRFHHRLLHEEGYGVMAPSCAKSTSKKAGEFVFSRPDGTRIHDAPAPPAMFARPGHVIERQHRDAGLIIDADTTPLWNGDSLDMGLALIALRRSPG